MKRTFNPKITEINNIGDELRFQREYYNFKHSSKKLIPRVATRVNAETGEFKSKFLGDVLQDFLDTHFEYMKTPKKTDRENYGEYGTGEDLLYAIEHNKLKSGRDKKKEMYNPNAYYLRMYSLFKIYGFLDDFEIILLLNKYNIKPRFDKTKIEIQKIIDNYKQLTKMLRVKDLFDFKEKCNIHIQSSELYRIFKEDLKKDNPRFVYLNDSEKEFRSNMQFTKAKKIIIEKIKTYSLIDRKCISLEIGKDSNFLEELINEKIDSFTFETLYRLTNFLELKNTDLGFIAYQISAKVENNQSDRTLEEMINTTHQYLEILDNLI